MKTAPDRKIPLVHPDYRYPESGNPYWKKLRDLPPGLVYCDNDTELYRGVWRDKFFQAGKNGKLTVEIGCNGGHVALGLAQRAPEEFFIGLDWKFKQIHRAAVKAAALGLKNMIFLRANAQRLGLMFGPGELDRVLLFFPDPWPRKSQHKNRFVTSENLKMLWTLLGPGGELVIRTDHDGYFEWMLAALEEARANTRAMWRDVRVTRDLHAAHPDPRKLEMPDVTLFERLFIRDGIRIKQIIAAR